MTQEKTTQPEPSKAKAQPKPRAATKNPVDADEYKKYTELKFLQFSLMENPDSEARMKDGDIKTINELEEKISKCSGKVATRTVRAALGNEQCLMIKGIPVPDEVAKIVQEWEDSGVKGANAYYFG